MTAIGNKAPAIKVSHLAAFHGWPWRERRALGRGDGAARARRHRVVCRARPPPPILPNPTGPSLRIELPATFGRSGGGARCADPPRRRARPRRPPRSPRPRPPPRPPSAGLARGRRGGRRRRCPSLAVTLIREALASARSALRGGPGPQVLHLEDRALTVHRVTATETVTVYHR